MNHTRKDCQEIVDVLAKHLMNKKDAVATFWRKVVGKDITIYVTDFDAYGHPNHFVVYDPRGDLYCDGSEHFTVLDLFSDIENSLRYSENSYDWRKFYKNNNLIYLEENHSYKTATIEEVRDNVYNYYCKTFPEKLIVQIKNNGIFIGAPKTLLQFVGEYIDIDNTYVFLREFVDKNNPAKKLLSTMGERGPYYQATIMYDWKKYKVKTTQVRKIK